MTRLPRLFFTFGQVARAIGVRKKAVALWVADGRLLAVDIDGRRRIPASELERVQRDGIPKVEAPKRRRASAIARDPGGDIRKLEIV